jgi:hypothetical protein
LFKVTLQFYFFKDENKTLSKIDELEVKKIRYETGNGSQSIFDEDAIKICSAFLKIVANMQQCTNEDIPHVNTDHLSNEFKEIYNYVELKLDPLLLFKSGKVGNIALFMKASFLRYSNTDYNFVRKGNIISSFMHK